MSNCYWSKISLLYTKIEMQSSPREKNVLSRSARLRKYEIAYEEFIKKANTEKYLCIKKSTSRRCRPSVEIQKSPNKKSRNRPSVKVQKSPDKKPRNRPCVEVQKSPHKKQEKKRPLNSYQEFVREESKNIKYKGFLAHERMTSISKEWNKQKILKNL